MITPIDLQVNIGHLHEIGRAEHSRNAAVDSQQGFLDDEAARLTNLKKERIEESQKAEHSTVNDSLADEKEKEKEKRKEFSRGHDETDSRRPVNVLYDDKLGREIDVFK